MSEDNLNRPSGEPEEEMSVELELEDGTLVNCAVITILDVAEKSYIVLLPLDENGQNEDGEVWFYGYSEKEEDPNAEPELRFIEDDDEYEMVADAFDEMCIRDRRCRYFWPFLPGYYIHSSLQQAPAVPLTLPSAACAGLLQYCPGKA